MATERSRLFIPALAPIYAGLSPIALPLLRVALGIILIPHGCQKLFGWFGGAGFARFTQIFESIGYRPGAGLREGRLAALPGLERVLVLHHDAATHGVMRDAAEFGANVSITDIGSDILITIGADTITLAGVSGTGANGISIDDFKYF